MEEGRRAGEGDEVCGGRLRDVRGGGGVRCVVVAVAC